MLHYNSALKTFRSLSLELIVLFLFFSDEYLIQNYVIINHYLSNRLVINNLKRLNVEVSDSFRHTYFLTLRWKILQQHGQ